MSGGLENAFQKNQLRSIHSSINTKSDVVKLTLDAVFITQDCLEADTVAGLVIPRTTLWAKQVNLYNISNIILT